MPNHKPIADQPVAAETAAVKTHASFITGELVIWRNRCVAVVMSDGKEGMPAYVNIGHMRQEPLDECDRLADDAWLNDMEPERQANLLSLRELMEVLTHAIPYGDDTDQSRAAENVERVRKIWNRKRGKVE